MEGKSAKRPKPHQMRPKKGSEKHGKQDKRDREKQGPEKRDQAKSVQPGESREALSADTKAPEEDKAVDPFPLPEPPSGQPVSSPSAGSQSKLMRVLATVVLAMVMVSLTILVIRFTRAPTVVICDTPGCVAHAKQLKSAMNSDVQPCANFYSFVCGSWTPIEHESSMIERMYYNMRKIAIQELQVDPKASPVPLAPLYFRSCLAAVPGSRVKGEIEKFRSFKRGLGLTWPEEWPESNRTVPPLKILINLSVNWNIHLIFKLHAMPAYQGRPKALYVSNGDWTPTWQNVTDVQFAERVKEHCSHMGVNATGDLAELLSSLLAVINATVAVPTDPSYEDKLTIKDIDHDANLTVYLNDIYNPQFVWKPEDVVLVRHPDLIARLEHLILTVPEAALRMALSWTFIRLYLWKVIGKPELWAKGDATALQATTQLTCLTHLEETFGLVVTAKRIRERFNKTLRSRINKFFDMLRDQVKSQISNASWIDDLVKKKSIAKIDDIWRSVLPDDRFFSSYSVAALYKDFPEVGVSFMDNFINLAKAFRKTMDKDDYVTVFSKGLGSGNVASRYSYYYNSVSMDVGALEPPLVYDDGSFAMTFGSLGTILASAMVRAFDARGVLYNEKGEEEPWWSEGREEFDKRIKCNLGGSLFASSTLGPFLSSLPLALHISHQAYRTAVKFLDSKDIYSLKGLEDYTDDQVFFMTYCLMTCATDSNGDLCNVPMRNSRKFAAAFQCNPGDEMDPSEKCSFFG